MPNRGPAIDPFILKEASRKIPCSFSIPVGYLTALQKHREETRVPASDFITSAIETHAKKVGLELPEIQKR